MLFRVRRFWVLVFVLLLSSGILSAQIEPRPDPYKSILDRLASLTVLPVTDWRFHADLPHPEDPVDW